MNRIRAYLQRRRLARLQREQQADIVRAVYSTPVTTNITIASRYIAELRMAERDGDLRIPPETMP